MIMSIILRKNILKIIFIEVSSYYMRRKFFSGERSPIYFLLSTVKIFFLKLSENIDIIVNGVINFISRKQSSLFI